MVIVPSIMCTTLPKCEDRATASLRTGYGPLNPPTQRTSWGPRAAPARHIVSRSTQTPRHARLGTATLGSGVVTQLAGAAGLAGRPASACRRSPVSWSTLGDLLISSMGRCPAATLRRRPGMHNALLCADHDCWCSSRSQLAHLVIFSGSGLWRTVYAR